MLLIYCLTPSDWIQLLILIVVSLYTTFTYLLWRQQKANDTLSLRPWMHPKRLVFENNAAQPRIAFFLDNYGKLPAECKVHIKKVTLQQPDNTQDTFTPEKPGLLIVYPNSPDPISNFIFYINLNQNEDRLFVNGSRLELEVSLSYKTLTDKSQRYPYSYSAKLRINNFQREKGQQDTELLQVDSK